MLQILAARVSFVNLFLVFKSFLVSSFIYRTKKKKIKFVTIPVSFQSQVKSKFLPSYLLILVISQFLPYSLSVVLLLQLVLNYFPFSLNSIFPVQSKIRGPSSHCHFLVISSIPVPGRIQVHSYFIQSILLVCFVPADYQFLPSSKQNPSSLLVSFKLVFNLLRLLSNYLPIPSQLVLSFLIFHSVPLRGEVEVTGTKTHWGL